MAWFHHHACRSPPVEERFLPLLGDVSFGPDFLFFCRGIRIFFGLDPFFLCREIRIYFGYDFLFGCREIRSISRSLKLHVVVARPKHRTNAWNWSDP